MTDTVDSRLRGLLDRWDDVEGSIKKAELFQGQVTIPAVNELRYAGRQIIKAMRVREEVGRHTAGSNDAVPDHEYLRALTNAEQYVMNADHDVVDGVVVFVSLRIAELNFRFGRDTIAKYYPKYLSFCELVEHCKSEVERSRRVKSSERSTIYRTLKLNHLQVLMDTYTDVVNSETIMAAQLDAVTRERQSLVDRNETVARVAKQRLVIILILMFLIISASAFILLGMKV